MDQELIHYLDNRFHSLEQKIDQRFGQVDQHFGQIDQRFEQMDQRFAGVDGQIKGLRQEMCEGFDEVKRHNGILIEDLRYQVQLVAEGFTIFVEGRYTQDQARIDERFHETRALIHSSYSHLSQQDDQIQRRIEHLERKSQG